MKGFQKLWIRNLSLGVACFSLFAIFSLAINTKGVSALRHDVNYIPLASQTSFRAGGVTDVRNPLFSFYWAPGYVPSFHSANLKAPYYYYTVSKTDYSGCEYRSGGQYGRGVNIQSLPNGSLTISHGFNSYNYIYDISEGSSNFMELICRQNRAFGNINTPPDSNIIYHPSLDESSLVNIPLADRPLYKDLTRYYYDYDSIYLSDTSIDSSTGIHYSKTFSISQLYPEFIPTKFSRFTMPLGKANEGVGVVNQGRQIEFDMIFNFTNHSNVEKTIFEWNPDLSSDASVRLYVIGEYEDSSVSTPLSSIDYVDCSTTLVRAELDIGNPSAQLELSCNYTATHNFLDTHLWFYLQMAAGSSDYLFDTEVDWSFSGVKFITDNDDTPGSTWGTEPTGQFLDRAPGKAVSSSSDEDFFSSLKNMFTFNFINPFATIFQLFSDNNECAQIPILADMLHSNETVVCPWFSSSVRQIVTPVLGMSSMALVFGFAVHWLGSSSGNMFEDTETHSWGKLRFKGKGK